MYKEYTRHCIHVDVVYPVVIRRHLRFGFVLCLHSGHLYKSHLFLPHQLPVQIGLSSGPIPRLAHLLLLALTIDVAAPLSSTIAYKRPAEIEVRAQQPTQPCQHTLLFHLYLVPWIALASTNRRYIPKRGFRIVDPHS